MLFPIKVHYAAIAMVHLTSQYDSGIPVSLREIADQHAVPLPFLTQIFQSLKSAGLVVASRGPGGGYRLAQSPSDLSMLQVVEAVFKWEGLEPAPPEDASAISWILRDYWSGLDESIKDRLAQSKLDQLEASQSTTDAMFYI